MNFYHTVPAITAEIMFGRRVFSGLPQASGRPGGGVTRTYFGGSSDWPSPADYSGDGADDIGIFRESSGLWAVRGVTRVYYGSSGDIPVAR